MVCYSISGVVNCLVTGPIIDHLGLLRRIILRLVRPTINRYGDRASSIAGPRFWNDLPLEVRQSASENASKGALKTHLINQPTN